jgi:hypothetical protein
MSTGTRKSVKYTWLLFFANNSERILLQNYASYLDKSCHCVFNSKAFFHIFYYSGGKTQQIFNTVAKVDLKLREAVLCKRSTISP